jgi:hypothetical protein
MRRAWPLFFGVLLGTGAFVAPGLARATEPSSFFSVGGGYGLQHNGTIGEDAHRGAMSLALGVGTSPLGRMVYGGVFRTTTYFRQGTDLGLAARVVQGSYARGGFGLGFDLGVGGRFYRNGEYGQFPVQVKGLFGAPWGLGLALGADLFSIDGRDPPARGFVALIEIDLLRLTVNRQGDTERYWYNPAPAGGHLRKPRPEAPAPDATE